MNFYIKNNNIYYEDYKIFDGRLSLALVPIAVLIILNKKFIKYFSYIFLCIALIGIVDSYLEYERNKKLLFIITFAILFHGILLYPLINIKKYLKPNLCNLALGIIGIFIIYFLPYWPYAISKIHMILSIPVIYFLTMILYKLNSK
jgi:UDP-N-acetylmuramyl pentapeptide phosphotransferase/UDP-N-acetylglucosamine-1-phosphate transferase